MEKSPALRDNSGKAISMIQGANTYYFIYNGHPACQRLFALRWAKVNAYAKINGMNKNMWQALAGRGDVTSLTDQSGTVVATYSYDEFGSLDNRNSTIDNIYNPLRYSGAHNAYYDTETSLYKMGTRYYQPDIGRWLIRDSYKGDQQEPLTQNKYIYVANNPVNKTDSTGYWADQDHWYVSIFQASKVGLNQSTAYGIASENKTFDTVYNAVEYPKYHFNMIIYPRFTKTYNFKAPWRKARIRRGDTRTNFAYTKLKQARKEKNQNKVAAYKISLGRGLHSVQDTYAHLNAMPWEHQLGKDAGKYDNIGWNPYNWNRWQRTWEATELYLRDFLK